MSAKKILQEELAEALEPLADLDKKQLAFEACDRLGVPPDKLEERVRALVAAFLELREFASLDGCCDACTKLAKVCDEALAPWQELGE